MWIPELRRERPIITDKHNDIGETESEPEHYNLINVSSLVDGRSSTFIGLACSSDVVLLALSRRGRHTRPDSTVDFDTVIVQPASGDASRPSEIQPVEDQ